MDQLARVAVRRAHAALGVALDDVSQKELARDYVRALIARSTDVLGDPISYAEKRWGADSRVVEVMKAGVPASGSGETALFGHSPRDAFFSLVLEASILGKLTRARRVPFNVRTLVPGAGSTGYWVGESQAVPMSAFTLAGVTLDVRKTAGLAILTKESVQDPASELRVFEDLFRACTGTLDQAAVGAQAGTESTPAGILNGVSAGASTGDAASDVAGLVENFAGDLASAAVITDPLTAVQIALTGGTPFHSLGANGGTALGLPWITSRSSPRDSSGGQLVLLDEAGLALGLDGIEIQRSTAASIEADDEPTADAGAPTAGTAHRINLFQSELVAFLATIHGNWRVLRPGAVSAVTGTDYAVSVS